MSLFKLVPDSIVDPAGSVVSQQNDLGYSTTAYRAVPTIESGTINVIDTMQFATNDIVRGSYLANKIPVCILKEYDLITNSSVSQLLYYARSVGFNSVIQNTLQFGKIAGDTAQSFLDNNSTGVGIKDFATGTIKELINVATQPIEDILKSNEPFFGSLHPYQNLYLRKSTNFKYVLPFFTDTKKDVQNAFSDSQTGLLAGNKVANYMNTAKTAYDAVAKNLLFATPGAYIEQPKFFDMGGSGESYEIKFDLINTINADRVQTHFDFLFLLAYQNLPFRKNIAQITLPKIYACIIPGEIYLPYAYISSLKIDFIGNRRNIKLLHPKGIYTDCIVPEVYSVSLTIQGLTSPAANYMIADELFKISSTSVEPVEPTTTTNFNQPGYRFAQPDTNIEIPKVEPPKQIPNTTPSIVPSKPLFNPNLFNPNLG